MVLGGQHVSRINLNWRAEKGITYGAAYRVRLFADGPVRLPFRPAWTRSRRALAIRESIGEIAAIRERTADIRRRARRGAWPRSPAATQRNFETSDQIARAGSHSSRSTACQNDYYSQFVPRVESLTPDDVMGASRQASRSYRLTTLHRRRRRRRRPRFLAASIWAIRRRIADSI